MLPTVKAVLVFLAIEAFVIAAFNPWTLARRAQNIWQHPRDWQDPKPPADGGKESMNLAWFQSAIFVTFGTAMAFAAASQV